MENITSFTNNLVNKSQLKQLMYNAFLNYGIVKSSVIADRIKNLTFHYATQSGISLSIEDLRVPNKKLELIGLTNNEVQIIKEKYEIGKLTDIERFQKTIDTWNNANNFLKDEVLTYFRESDPLNPLYIMAFSGARGNISQVRQLVGMRGLMADPQGQIIDLPIRSNFREGLNVTEYIISSYGARKGLVDTALRTADSGYLTRRLVDVAQDIIIREEDCGTDDSLSESEVNNDSNEGLSRFIGRLLAHPLFDENNNLLAPRNSEITPSLVEKLEKSGLGYKELKIRSPLTCNSIRSVCRKCYGWHLAYSRIVDLGEAVGIVAAQSIGEPGTQLTMRTFHTGGVFSGDLTYQVRSPYEGIVHYDTEVQAFLFRTLHGELGFRINKKVQLSIFGPGYTKISFDIPPEGILLVNSKQKVYKNEIIAEIKKDTDVILEDERKDIIARESGTLYFHEANTSSTIIDDSLAQPKIKDTNLIWVLEGKLYAMPDFNGLSIKPGTVLKKNSVLTKTNITNKYSGIAYLHLNAREQHVKILHHSVVLKNLIGEKKVDESYDFKFDAITSTNTLHLEAKPETILKNGDAIAILQDSLYKTEVGGIITYTLEKSQSVKKKKTLRKLFSGAFYWIPEETHQIKNTILLKTIKVNNGSLITPGTEILPNIFSKVGGLVNIDDIEQEIVIKPGELINLTKLKLKNFNKTNRFVKVGEAIIPNRLIAQRLVYLEFFNIFELSYLLIRPVKTYSVSKSKIFELEQLFKPSASKDYVRFKTVKKVFYKNWERVISNTSVDLLKTFLIVDFKKPIKELQPYLHIISSSVQGKNSYNLKIAFYETVNFNNSSLKNLDKSLKPNIRLVIKDQQYICSNTILAYNEITIQQPGILAASSSDENELLILENHYLKSFSYNFSPQQLKIKIGDLVRSGTLIGKNIRSPYSGQVFKISEEQITIRLGRPYLISRGTILRIKNGALVKQCDTLATLLYERVKTTDIVQGLPKVEEILEARKIRKASILATCPGYAYFRPSMNNIEIYNLEGNKTTISLPREARVQFTNGQYVELSYPLTDGIISPHSKLEVLFEYYKTKYNILTACKLSVKSIQLFLVNEIQKTYLAQGVQIADKHLEVIVRQMTSKVCISDSGNTTFLPGEILDLKKIEAIVKIAQEHNDEPPLYYPILLGITKAALNSDSFISAASFQETTRVLTEAAVEGKKDWLNGLKENVIIGRLIPAGTGFSYSDNCEMLERERHDTENFFHQTGDITKAKLLRLRVEEKG